MGQRRIQDLAQVLSVLDTHEFVLDDIQTMKCTGAQLKEYILEAIGGGTPLGHIMMYPSITTLPAGYLLANGQLLDEDLYPALFELIGTRYNKGDEPTGYFRAPNYQGLVPRGWGSQFVNGRLKDGGDLGEILEDMLQSHTHSTSVYGLNNNATWANNGIWMAGQAWNGSSTKNLTVDTDGVNFARAGSETRASSLSTVFLIKAFNASYVDATTEVIDVLNAEIQDVKDKQDKQKRITCFASQRTFNLSGSYGEFGAADDGTSVASTDSRRRLNEFSTNAPDFFEIVNLGLATNFIRIKKAGIYSIKFTSVNMRSGNSTYCYLNSHDPVAVKTVRFDTCCAATVATGATAAGNVLPAAKAVKIEFASGTREITLWHFFATKTVGFNYGRFGINAAEYADTCSIEIDLIEEL